MPRVCCRRCIVEAKMMWKGLLAAIMVAVLAVPAASQELTGRFKLQDHDTRMVTEQSYTGKIRLVTFGYTFCPDVCPTTLSTMAAALDLLGADADQVVPLFITVDPKRDTAEHLKDYMAAFGPRFIGLTGTREMVAEAAFQYKARYRIHKPDEAGVYFIDHTAGIFIMDRQGGFVAKLSHTATPREVVDAVQAIITPDRRSADPG
ncbi:MAG: SCO family protein [Rhodospirillaceae bacterium]|nr:SCO family protein [Rhodospirillales bacterium]